MSSLTTNNPNVFYHKYRGRLALIATAALLGAVYPVRNLFLLSFSFEWLTQLILVVVFLFLAIDLFQTAFWTRLCIMPEGLQYRHLLFTALIEWSHIQLEPTYMRVDGSCEYKLIVIPPIFKPGSRLSALIPEENQKNLLRLDRFIKDWHASPLLNSIQRQICPENETKTPDSIYGNGN